MLKILKAFIVDRYVKHLHATLVNMTIDNRKKDQTIKNLRKENKELRVLLANLEVILETLNHENTLKMSMN